MIYNCGRQKRNFLQQQQKKNIQTLQKMYTQQNKFVIKICWLTFIFTLPQIGINNYPHVQKKNSSLAFTNFLIFVLFYLQI